MESSFQTQQEPDTKEDSHGDTPEPKVQGQPCLFTNFETVSKQTNKEYQYQGGRGKCVSLDKSSSRPVRATK